MNFPPGSRVYHHNHRWANAYIIGSATLVGIGDDNGRHFDYVVDVDGLYEPPRRTQWPSHLTYLAEKQPWSICTTCGQLIPEGDEHFPHESDCINEFEPVGNCVCSEVVHSRCCSSCANECSWCDNTASHLNILSGQACTYHYAWFLDGTLSEPRKTPKRKWVIQ